VVAQHPTGLLCRLQDLVPGRLSARAGAQDALVESCDVNLVEAGHHEVGLGRPQERLVSEACDAERGHPARLGGLDPGRSILNDEALFRLHAQLLRGEEEECWIRLAARYVTPADVRFEEGQKLASVWQLDATQHGGGVLGRGGERQPQAGALELGGETDSIRKGLKAAFGDASLDKRLFGLRIGRGFRLGVRHAEHLEGRDRARQPRLARDIRLIERGGEQVGLGEARKRLAPGALMR
jgi:hypothetical protein